MDLARIKELEQKTLNDEASEQELSEYADLLREYSIECTLHHFSEESQDNSKSNSLND